jgi:hypothetical protein
MAVISIRLNEEEEKILSFLSSKLEKDTSSLIKYSLTELYEDYIDNKIIDEYEIQEKKEKPRFINSEAIIEAFY